MNMHMDLRTHMAILHWVLQNMVEDSDRWPITLRSTQNPDPLYTQLPGTFMCTPTQTHIHTYTYSLAQTLTLLHQLAWMQMVSGGKSGCLFVACMTAQVVKTNGWTELHIHMQIIYISNMYIYAVKWREGREGKRLPSEFSCLLSVFDAFPVFHPAAHKVISQATIIDASFFISELRSHDLRIIAVMLQNKKPNRAVICRWKEASITPRPE